MKAYYLTSNAAEEMISFLSDAPYRFAAPMIHRIKSLPVAEIEQPKESEEEDSNGDSE